MGLADVLGAKSAKDAKAKAKEEAYRAEHPTFVEVLSLALARMGEKKIEPDMWLGPSSIADMCPKAMVLACRMGGDLVSHNDAKSSWIMGMGTAIHSFLQISSGRAGVLLGGWKCHVCHAMTGDVLGGGVSIASAVPMPDRCPHCRHEPGWRTDWEYVEPTVQSESLRIRGHLDGILELPGRHREIVDFKTSKSTAMASRTGLQQQPYRSNVIQLNVYLGLAGMEYGRLIYVDRGADSPSGTESARNGAKPRPGIIEHPVVFNRQMYEDTLEMVDGFRQAAADGNRPIPCCPHAGSLPWGDCECKDMERAWAHFGT